jgi:hypothetical protein
MHSWYASDWCDDVLETAAEPQLSKMIYRQSLRLFVDNAGELLTQFLQNLVILSDVLAISSASQRGTA